MRITTLKHLATAINAIGNGYTAVTEKSWTSTDRYPKGVRWRVQGKGRNGTRIIVKDPQGATVLRCDTSETTTVETAILRAIEIFGDKLDLDPGELYAVGDQIRVIKYTSTEGAITAVTMRNKTKARHYEVRLVNGHIMTVEPWRIRRLKF